MVAKTTKSTLVWFEHFILIANSLVVHEIKGTYLPNFNLTHSSKLMQVLIKQINGHTNSASLLKRKRFRILSLLG